MKIYTKQGDKGNTSLLGGKRVSKTNLRVKAYGETDELNSFIGLLITELNKSTDAHQYIKTLNKIQQKLLLTGSYLADKKGKFIKEEDLNNLKKGTEALEKEIDKMQNELPELKNFILPGGTKSASLAHVCRTITRRVERSIVGLKENDIKVNKHVNTYINRLSDYFFVLARYLNFLEGEEDKIWKK